MPETPQEAFARGITAGEVAQRLTSAETHLNKINGSMETVATKLSDVERALQRLADQAVARDATVITTAAALKDADQARRDKDEYAWTPAKRVYLVLSIIVASGAVVAMILAAARTQ